MPETEAVTVEQLNVLLPDESIPVVDRALWAVLWDGQARLDDWLSVDVRDVNWEAGTLLVPPGSRVLDGFVPISSSALGLLRRVVGERDAGALFAGDDGRPLTRERVSASARKSGFGIHAFRLGGQLHRGRL